MTRKALALLAAFLVTTPGIASALPVPSFIYAPTTVVVGQSVTFDGTASTCGTATCRFQWSWEFRTAGGAVLNGGQMGEGQLINYTFDEFAASKPYVIVVLKVTESNPTHNFRTAQATFVVQPTTLAVETPTPSRFALHAIAPNPFRGTTFLRYAVPSPGGKVRLSVFDIGGRLVQTLADGPQSPGEKQLAWDGSDHLGHVLPAGTYLCRLQAAGFSQTRKLLLTR